jgi:hypothetical protein
MAESARKERGNADRQWQEGRGIAGIMNAWQIKSMENDVPEKLFAMTKRGIPSSRIIASSVIEASEFSQIEPEALKVRFSEAIDTLQIAAYHEYQRLEALNAEASIRNVFKTLIPDGSDIDQAVNIFASQFTALDRFALSLTQSRRSRAGEAFEVIVAYLFNKLDYPYSAQPDLVTSKPDYVLPGLERYQKYPADCIIFTLKRTLRERWRQIVTESATGRFYLATIDDKISENQLSIMMGKNITLVVPVAVKHRKYPNFDNVISFENFFEDHLDPAMIRWRKNGAI